VSCGTSRGRRQLALTGLAVQPDQPPADGKECPATDSPLSSLIRRWIVRGCSGVWIARRKLALGLVVAFASTGMGGHSTVTHERAAISINAATWAPEGAGAYFFDRSAPRPSAPSDFARRESQFGRKFDGHMYYLPTHVTIGNIAGAHWSLATDHVPFVILSWSTGNNPDTIIPGIAAGKYDSEITRFANAVKSQLSPYGHTLIRPFWEFNFTGSEWNDIHYGNRSTVFIAAWRHFVNIFRAHHVENVKWLWNPIRVGGSQAQDPVPYYPGSSYVDWIGIDAYPKHKWLTLQQLATTSGGSSNFDWYHTFSRYGKPLMFGEVGILPASFYGSGAPTRATWWKDALNELRHSLTRVKAIEYFDSDTAYDWRYDAPGKSRGDSGVAALEAARGVTRSCYLNVQSRACRHPAPHPSVSRESSPPLSSATARPSARPSSSPHVSSPAAGPSPLGAAAIAGVVALVVVGTVLAYRRFRRR